MLLAYLFFSLFLPAGTLTPARAEEVNYRFAITGNKFTWHFQAVPLPEEQLILLTPTPPPFPPPSPTPQHFPGLAFRYRLSTSNPWLSQLDSHLLLLTQGSELVWAATTAVADGEWHQAVLNRQASQSGGSDLPPLVLWRNQIITDFQVDLEQWHYLSAVELAQLLSSAPEMIALQVVREADGQLTVLLQLARFPELAATYTLECVDDQQQVSRSAELKLQDFLWPTQSLNLSMPNAATELLFQVSDFACLTQVRVRSGEQVSPSVAAIGVSDL